MNTVIAALYDLAVSALDAIDKMLAGGEYDIDDYFDEDIYRDAIWQPS